jgi:succinyl-diaminopimelate desuccinylase
VASKGTATLVSWGDPSIQHVEEDSGIDRLGLASPLLGATGWIDGLARLISIDTSSAPGCYSGPFAGVLQDMFAPLGFSFRRLEVPPNMLPRGEPTPRINMVAGRRTGRRICTIYFHTDTLPAGEGWSRPPFSLSRQGNRLYGRGTADMKGAIAAVWSALRAADAVGLGLRFDPVLLFCTDEEGGLYPGLRHLAAEGLIEGHVMCLNGPAAPRIWAGSLGRIDFSVRIDAAPLPQDTGDANAVEAAALFASRLSAMKEGIEVRHSDLLATAAPPAGAPLQSGMSVSAIKGGGNSTFAPGSCALTVSREYLPEEDFETVRAEVLAMIRQAAERLPGFRMQAEMTGHRAPVSRPDQGPNWPRWQQALSWGFGYSSNGFRRSASREPSAMGFVQQAGVQEILLSGLGRPNSQKGEANEFTTIEDVEALARSVLAYLADVPEIPRY